MANKKTKIYTAVEGIVFHTKDGFIELVSASKKECMFARVREVFFEDEEDPDMVTKKGQILDITKSDLLRIIKAQTGRNYTDVEIVSKVRMSEPEQQEEQEAMNAPETLTGEVVENGLQTLNHGLVVGFSKKDIEDYDYITEKISAFCRQTEQSAKEIAFNLYKVYNHGLYRIDGFKNIYDYANVKFNLARGTTNNFINIVDRFGSSFENGQMIEDKSSICEQYQEYSHSQLIAMLGHTDDELKDITSDMSVREIKRILKEKDNHVENPIDESADTEEMEQMEMDETAAGWALCLDKDIIFADCKRKREDFKKEVLHEYLYKNIDIIYDALMQDRLFIMKESDIAPIR